MSLGIFPEFSFIPPLYCLLYYVIHPINTSSLIFFQILLSFVSFASLLNQLNKLKPRLLFLNVFFICLISTKSYILCYETSFLTESIYTSLMILYAVNIIQIFMQPNLNRLYIINSLLVFLIAFTRSNGIYLYLFIVLSLIWLYYRKNKISIFRVYAISFMFFNLIWASFNYISY